MRGRKPVTRESMSRRRGTVVFVGELRRDEIRTLQASFRCGFMIARPGGGTCRVVLAQPLEPFAQHDECPDRAGMIFAAPLVFAEQSQGFAGIDACLRQSPAAQP